MFRILLGFLLAVSALAQATATPPLRKTLPPKLVLGIVIDQFRYDYLTRFRSEYTGGLKRLLDHGAVFTNAFYQHVPTVTAVGHSTFLSGATPAMSGIVGNEWFDRATAKRVTNVSDETTDLLGVEAGAGTHKGSSPRRLLQSTIGDELKMSGKGGKVIGVSIKDRSAILPCGHMADGAYWFDTASGNFVSSSYYFPALPKWLADLNSKHPADVYAGTDWMKHKLPGAGKELYGGIEYTPGGNELIQRLALAALSGEKLGAGAKIDLLTVSYSANDYVGHLYGPDSPEVHDLAIRVDKLIGELLAACEKQAGAGRVLVVLTADHGVSPVPETNHDRRMPGGRVDTREQRSTVEKALTDRFGAGNWVLDATEAGFYLNPAAISGRKTDREEMERVAAEALRNLPHVFRVYTRSQLLNGAILEDAVGVRVRNGFNAARSGDVIVILDPYWIPGNLGRAEGRSGTTHSAPFNYDTHVPVVFLGPQVRPGRYDITVAPNDIAPTLATMLEIETPSGSVGRVLPEMLLK
jgi:hypothetical protein